MARVKKITEVVEDSPEQQEIMEGILKRRARVNIDLYMALQLMANGEYMSLVAGKGIPEESWEKTFGARLWTLKDKDECRKCMDTLILAEMQAVGLPEYNIPAETICAFIVTLVKPVNWKIACYWYQNSNTANQILKSTAAEPSTFTAGLTADKMLAMCQNYAGPDFRPYTQGLLDALITQRDESV